MWYLVGLIWIAIMVAIIAAYTRKQRRRTGERALQMEKLVAELKVNPRRMNADDTVLKPEPYFSATKRILPQAAPFTAKFGAALLRLQGRVAGS